MSRKVDSGGAGLWIIGAFCIALILAISILVIYGVDKAGLEKALRATGRLSFLLFWPAYAGGAVAALFGPRCGVFSRYRREFGLAFAAAQLVHFALIGWLIYLSHQPFVEGVMPFFAIGAVWILVLAVSSATHIRNLFDTGLWQIVNAIGLEYIALVLVMDFVLGPVQAGISDNFSYAPFSILLLGGVLLRVAALVSRAGLSWRHAVFPNAPR